MVTGSVVGLLCKRFLALIQGVFGINEGWLRLWLLVEVLAQDFGIPFLSKMTAGIIPKISGASKISSMKMRK